MNPNFFDWLEENLTLLVMLFILFLMISLSSNSQVSPEYIAGFGIDHEDVVYAQLMLESGNLNCENCSWSNHNNAFGFLKCTKRDSLNNCISWRYLHYDNLEHSLEAYREWQILRCNECETTRDYYDCLVKYWGAPDMYGYIEKLKKIQYEESKSCN